MHSIRIAAAQTPDFRNDVPQALRYLVNVVTDAEQAGASLIVFPEGFLQGYLLADALVRNVALDLRSEVFDGILARFPKAGPMIVVGLTEIADGQLYNTAIVVRNRMLIGRYRKTHLLPSERAFSPGQDCPVFTCEGLSFGINICYDTNFPAAAQRVADAGATLIVCCANNMMSRSRADKLRDVHNAARADRCRETGLWMVSSDVTGARDGMVSWGPTAVLSPAGAVVAQLPMGAPGLLVFDVTAAQRPRDSVT